MREFSMKNFLRFFGIAVLLAVIVFSMAGCEVECGPCRGSGTCGGCDGTGIYKFTETSEICRECKGSGICQTCNGKGKYIPQ
jgi:hypothetical protein